MIPRAADVFLFLIVALWRTCQEYVHMRAKDKIALHRKYQSQCERIFSAFEVGWRLKRQERLNFMAERVDRNGGETRAEV